MRRTFSALVMLGILFLPTVATAADWLPLIQCGGPGQQNCTPCDLFETVKRVFDLILYGITGPLAAFMIVLAGGMMLLGGAQPKLYSQGRTMLTNTLIGVTIILLAWLVTTFLVKSLIRTGQGDRWYEFSCPESLAAAIPAIETEANTDPTPNVPAPSYLPKNVGVAAAGQASAGGGGSASGGGSAGASASVCLRGTCPPGGGKCPRLSALFRGRSNARFLEYLAWHESSCGLNMVGSRGEYGLMQLLPSTANANRQGCDVTQTTTDAQGNESTVDVQITGAWLTSEENFEKVVCVADNYVNSLKGACGNDPYHLVAGYNGGSGVCSRQSQDCPDLQSCSGSGTMRLWECPWENREHTIANTGYQVTRDYAAQAVACLR